MTSAARATLSWDHSRLIRELQLELGKVDLDLLARWCLEANLEGRQGCWTHVAQRVANSRVSTLVSALANLPP
jgi:hypothetical protein